MTTHYAAVAGDPLDSGPGNYVMDQGHHDATIEGTDGVFRNVALIGDGAYCSRCNSVGLIIGGASVREDNRMLFEQYGRRQAVGDDNVACKCPTHPRIVAKFGRNWELVDWIGSTTAAAYGSLEHTFGYARSHTYDEQYTVTDDDGKPLANVRYRSRHGTDVVASGVTDSSGRTQRITTDESARLILEVPASR